MAATAAQQVTPFLNEFLTKYGMAIQAGGFLGWLLVGIAGIAIAIALFMVVGPIRRAASEYVRMVESKIGPAPEKEDEGLKDESKKDTSVDEFVE
jgi:hypothetical protein